MFAPPSRARGATLRGAMVRLHSGPLFLSLHLPGADEPIVRLRVDAARFWLLSTVTVLLQPPGCHIGRQFTSVSDAMGQMARFLPEYMRGSLRYMEYLRAYVVGDFDDELLEDIPCTTGGGLADVVKHSPRQATLLVRCFEAPHMAAGSGRWVPVGQLRPFAPPELSNEQMRDQVEKKMAKVCSSPLLA